MPTPKKAYCFTLNNYSEEEYDNIVRTLTDEASYAIIGKEVGGTSSTPHLQGYCLFKRSYRFETIKNRYLPRCHIEVAAGTADANKRYCSKDGDYIEIGSMPTSRRSRDELAIEYARLAQSGHGGVVQFASEQPGTYYFSGHNLLRNYVALQRPIDRPSISCQWIYGEPGVGKSRRAHDTYPEAYIKEPRTKWWNGYMFEDSVIIDDFGPNGIDINHLLRWFDRYKCTVESKGGMIALYATKFIVTSNFHPGEIFKFGDEVNPQLPALLRRIELIAM